MYKSFSMTYISRFALLSIIIFVCIACDQWTKMLAESYLSGHFSLSYFNNMFSLVYAENAGTLLGIGSRLSESLRFVYFVLIIGIVLVAVIVYALVKPFHKMTVIAISFVVGGGISNLIDRLIHDGSVIDFMVIKIGAFETGIFNIADVAITLGVCMLIIPIFTQK
jgi:signal peptidase II